MKPRIVIVYAQVPYRYEIPNCKTEKGALKQAIKRTIKDLNYDLETGTALDWEFNGYVENETLRSNH